MELCVRPVAEVVSAPNERTAIVQVRALLREVNLPPVCPPCCRVVPVVRADEEGTPCCLVRDELEVGEVLVPFHSPVEVRRDDVAGIEASIIVDVGLGTLVNLTIGGVLHKVSLARPLHRRGDDREVIPRRVSPLVPPIFLRVIHESDIRRDEGEDVEGMPVDREGGRHHVRVVTRFQDALDGRPAHHLRLKALQHDYLTNASALISLLIGSNP